MINNKRAIKGMDALTAIGREKEFIESRISSEEIIEVLIKQGYFSERNNIEKTSKNINIFKTLTLKKHYKLMQKEKCDQNLISKQLNSEYIFGSNISKLSKKNLIQKGRLLNISVSRLMKKNDLISLINNFIEEAPQPLEVEIVSSKLMNMGELKKKALSLGIEGVDKIKRKQLIQLINQEDDDHISKEPTLTYFDKLSITIEELKIRAKDLNIQNFDSLKKRQLLKEIIKEMNKNNVGDAENINNWKEDIVLSQELENTNYQEMNVSALKEEASKLNITGTSKLNKEKLIKVIESKKLELEGNFSLMTVVELRKKAKNLNINGISNFKKDELIEEINIRIEEIDNENSIFKSDDTEIPIIKNNVIDKKDFIKSENIDYKSKKVSELKEIAGGLNIEISRLKKEEILKLIISKISKLESDYSALTVTELRSRAKKLKITKFSKLKRNELIKAIDFKINENVESKFVSEEKNISISKNKQEKPRIIEKIDYRKMKLTELKEKAKELNIEGISKFKKEGLIKEIVLTIHSAMTVKDLRDKAKKLNITGVSKLKKEELIKELNINLT